MNRFLLKAGNKIVYGLFTIIATYLFLLSIFTTCLMAYTDEHIFYIKDFAILICIGILSVCMLLAWFHKYHVGKSIMTKQLKTVACVLTILFGTLMCVFILKMRLWPIYDQGAVLEYTRELLQGNYSGWEEGEYFAMFTIQNGMVFMEMPFALMFGDNAYIAIQIWNVLMLILGYLGIAKITRIFTDEKTAYYVYICLICILPMWTNCTLVYGNYSAMTFSIWAIYFEIIFEKSKKWKYILYSGICIFFGLSWKTNAQVFWFTILIMLLVFGLREKQWKTSLGGLVLVVFFGLLSLKGFPYLAHVITGENTSQGIPLISWFAMGIQESSVAPGWFNEFQVNLYRNVSRDPAVISAESVKSIRETLTVFGQNPDYMFRFFARKVGSMWADPALQCFDVVNTRNLWGEFSYLTKDIFYNGGKINTILCVLLDIQQSMLYFGVVLYLILFRKKQKLEQSHLIVAFLGGFLYHFLSEAKSQYILIYYVLLVPYAVMGYRCFITKLSSISWKEKEERTALLQSGSVRWGMALAVLTIIIWIGREPVFENTVKIGTDTQDYIWYCQNETQWKSDDYFKV